MIEGLGWREEEIESYSHSNRVQSAARTRTESVNKEGGRKGREGGRGEREGGERGREGREGWRDGRMEGGK